MIKLLKQLRDYILLIPFSIAVLIQLIALILTRLSLWIGALILRLTTFKIKENRND